jgi:hypothetical protein
MTSRNEDVTFSQATKAEFLQYLVANPSNRRRVCHTQRATMIEWLTNPEKRPESQEEFSRRNYVRKTFAWDKETDTLLAVAKKNGEERRKVIVMDGIADTVEAVHRRLDHAGWDATWKEVSTSYYGILRFDVIFLLKRCQVCARDPSKRPKSSAATFPFQRAGLDFFDVLGTSNASCDESLSAVAHINGQWSQDFEDLYAQGSIWRPSQIQADQSP